MFDIAFSFASEDAWIAKDIKLILEHLGVNSYFSETLPDKANGKLHAELRKIYELSLLNVMILSEAYASKPKYSVVELEKKVLFGRHITNRDEKSLFILNIDNSSIPQKFNSVTFHPIAKCGINGAATMLKDRLIQKWHSSFRTTAEAIACHPVGAEAIRGALYPCEFVISTKFETDPLRRWQNVGDILVNHCGGPSLRNEYLSVYLIPSGRVPPYLAHSTLLKTSPEALRVKKALVKEFMQNHGEKRFRGDLFYIKKDGVEYPHVYCAELDAFFIQNHGKLKLE